MRTLAIDTSGDVSLVALTVEGELVCEIAARMRAKHGETLLGHVERVLATGGVSIDTLDLIAVGLGPGSFTGARIGLATAKGLCLARRTPLVGVRTTEVLACGVTGAWRVPVVDAHKGEVFAAIYDGACERRWDEAHGTPEQVGHAVRAWLGPQAPILVGSGLVPYGPRFTLALGAPYELAPPALSIPRAAILAERAERALMARGPDDLRTLEPLYIRAADAKLPD